MRERELMKGGCNIMGREPVYKEEMWFCPLCENHYRTEEEAMECWNIHYTEDDMMVEEFDYDPKKCFPEYVSIVSKDGGEATYKRVI